MAIIDPSFATIGPEWGMGGVGGLGPEAATAPAPPGGDFSGALTGQLQRLGELQTEAADQSHALATGTADDIGAVVASVERARLAMQLASQLRTRGIESIKEIFHTQV